MSCLCVNGYVGDVLRNAIDVRCRVFLCMLYVSRVVPMVHLCRCSKYQQLLEYRRVSIAIRGFRAKAALRPKGAAPDTLVILPGK